MTPDELPHSSVFDGDRIKSPDFAPGLAFLREQASEAPLCQLGPELEQMIQEKGSLVLLEAKIVQPAIFGAQEHL